MPCFKQVRFLGIVLLCWTQLPAARAQNVLTVENILTNQFPELGFEVRTTENLVANKSRLTVKDNYVLVPTFKVAAGKKAAEGMLYTIRYTVPDPQRFDGTTTFGYNGQEITTTYLASKPTPAQEKAYPKLERTDNTIFYVIGGLGVLAGIAGLWFSRRKSKKTPAPAVVMPPAPPVSSTSGTAGSGRSVPVAAGDAAYQPRPVPPATAENRVTETQVSPQILPTLTFDVNGQSVRLVPTGAPQKIGRSPECALVLTHPTVSKVHAQVQLRDGSWWIEDLGSTNGTYVDDQKITKMLLHNGSKLFLGQVSGMFMLPNSL
ncbi:MAG: FHA domain-containing protein [Sphingobacteriales bacterium]|nr:MAG: FHA domain-containing protein [Sphingobacteriales bacterium]